MMRLSTFFSAAFAAALCVGAVGCSEEKPAPETQQFPPPDTVASPFRMSAKEAPPIPQAPADLASDTVLGKSGNGKPAIFSVESLHLVQEYRGDRTGKKEVFIRDYGRYQRIADSSVPLNAKDAVPQQTILMISTPEFVGSYQKEYGQGWRSPNRYEQTYVEAQKAGASSLSRYSLEQMGAKHIGDTVINGYHTQVYRNDIGQLIHTLWIWREVALKEHFFAPYADVEYWLEPISIEAGATMPDSLFKFPKEYAIIDRPSPPRPSALPPPPLPGQ